MEKTPERLYKLELVTTTHTQDFPVFDPRQSWAGASLLLTTGTHLLLTKRSLVMPTHPGQMAFFAGYRKEGEEHPYQVVKREFVEESGVDADVLRIEGVLRSVATARGVGIVPVVARLLMPLPDFLRRAVSNGEWTDLLAVPWGSLADRSAWEWGWRKGATDQKILAFPVTPGNYLHQMGDVSQSFFLWGATARMVWDYLDLYHPGIPG